MVKRVLKVVLERSANPELKDPLANLEQPDPEDPLATMANQAPLGSWDPLANLVSKASLATPVPEVSPAPKAPQDTQDTPHITHHHPHLNPITLPQLLIMECLTLSVPCCSHTLLLHIPTLYTMQCLWIIMWNPCMAILITRFSLTS